MTRSKSFFSITILQIILVAVAVQCENDAKFNSDFEQFKKNLFSITDLDISKTISETIFSNWTDNHDCSIELDAIKSGLMNSEEWAFKIADAWGNFPSGVLNGNFFDLGSFSECFHIERNGNKYKTQYCIGRLILQSNEPVHRSQIKKIGLWNIRSNLAPSISLGICLPSACSVDQLEASVNRIVHARMTNMTVVIPKKFCQFKERFTHWRRIDFAAIGLLALLLLLMVASTGYDIFHTVYNRKKCQPLLMFSIYTNGMRLFSCQKSKSPDTIECLHGIRVLTAIWVVFGHTYRYGFTFETIKAQTYMETYRSAFMFSLMKVDTFFAISALLASIKMFKLLQKNGKLDVFPMYFHRYLRLTPILGACILMSMSFMRFLGNGPIWPQRLYFITKNCDRYWWSPLLYVQNYVNSTERLYIITPLIVYLIYRWKGKAFIGLLVLILAGIGYIVITHINYELTDFYSFQRCEKDQYLTHTRYPSWLIGIVAAYFLVEFPNGSIRIPKKVNLCAWALAIATTSFAVLGEHPYYQLKPQSTALEFGLFTALIRVAWPMAVCYIIFACARNCGGPVNWFLSHPLWQPLSRLSYATYLIHYPLIQMTASSESPPIFRESNAFQLFIGVYVLSILVAIPATLAFISPLDTIDKLIFRQKGVIISAKESLNAIGDKNICKTVEKSIILMRGKKVHQK